ncbi:MAG: tetratricopeptide repeat protein, partial [Chthoniobacteraceae bacterium]
RRQGRLPEAIAYYRRVFVAYQKYRSWVARAYLRCAESFDQMGKRQDAINNVREMLRSENLTNFPETREARKLLESWSPSA